MKSILALIILFCWDVKVSGQVTYTGRIGNAPIELVTDIYSDGDARAHYVYTKFDEPIVVNGRLDNGKLTLIEKDKGGKEKALLVFDNYDRKADTLTGIWRDIKSGSSYPVIIAKQFDLDLSFSPHELLQPVALRNSYFKLVITKTGNGNKVSAVLLLEKRTDRLLQRFSVDCQLLGINSAATGDFNFDGFMDFSVFERSYAGPNTSHLYFLFDPKTKRFFKSSFSGTSLEFDAKEKRIYEHNQCCAGNSHMNAEYKVVNNKMVLVKKTCSEYDEKKQDFVKVKCD
jgi:hypothetical protein